jgi:hypothetical protein
MKCDRVSQHSRNKSPRFKGLESFYMTGLAIQTFVRAGAQVMRRVNLQVEGRASRPSGGEDARRSIDTSGSSPAIWRGLQCERGAWEPVGDLPTGEVWIDF